MRPVLRLVLTYFTATPIHVGLSAAGLLCILFGAIGRLFLPRSLVEAAMRGPDAGMLAILTLGLPWLGLLLLVAATILMPAIVERLARGRSFRVLPGASRALFVSMLLTVGILSLIVAIEATVAFLDFRLEVPYATVFYRTLFMAFVDFGLIYAAVWLVAKTNGVWRLAGVLWIVISITIPLRYVGGIPEVSPLEAIGLASWIVVGALLLSGGHMGHSFRDATSRMVAMSQRLAPATRYRAGSELDLMLGMTQPWVIAIGQLVPIAAMAVLIRNSEIWLLVLMVFGAMAGAVTSRAASRSRGFWLRIGLTREQIVRRVEQSFWRYNARSLVVLLAVYIGLGVFAGFAPAQIVHGVILLVLGCAACTYLGLMITRELGWFETGLCILTEFALVIAAFATMQQAFLVTVQLELLLVGLVIAYRILALSRWTALDWMQCRGAPA